MRLRVLNHLAEDGPHGGGGAESAAELPSFAADVAPEEVAAWALERFGDGLIVTTGFGMEGCVLIDMLMRLRAAQGAGLRVHYLDTHFLFAETHDLRERLSARYPGVEFVNAGTSMTPEEQELAHGARLWERDPDACCAIRKVEPMRRLLKGARAWMTGLRQSQSEQRAGVRHADWDAGHGVVKVSPLAAWSREQVWAYAVERGVPYNPLHERGYPSIGCTNCTRAVPGAGVTDYTRVGRWAGTGKTECGLHFDGRAVRRAGDGG